METLTIMSSCGKRWYADMGWELPLRQRQDFRCEPQSCLLWPLNENQKPSLPWTLSQAWGGHIRAKDCSQEPLKNEVPNPMGFTNWENPVLSWTLHTGSLLMMLLASNGFLEGLSSNQSEKGGGSICSVSLGFWLPGQLWLLECDLKGHLASLLGLRSYNKAS